MFNRNKGAKINVKVLIILLLVTIALAASLFAARQVRREVLSKIDLEAGEAAFESEDWVTAFKHFEEYLGRNPDDVEILKKCAEACLSIRPLDDPAVAWAISAYRRVVQLNPFDNIAYDKLAMLYTGTGNFEELAYIARTQLTFEPNDLKSPLWLARAMVHLNNVQEAKQILEKFVSQVEALHEKHDEYVHACIQMSGIVGNENSAAAKTKALEWLNRAVDYMPDSVETLVSRALFYRETPNISGMSVEEQQALACKDLEVADTIGTEDPRIRFSMCAEWMAHGELGRADAELQAVDNLSQENLEEHFFDMLDCTVTKFLLSSELVMRQGEIVKGMSLADEILVVLKERRQRVQVLPSAIRLYIAAGKVAEARQYLDEFIDIMYAQLETSESQLRLAYLQALVARAEEKPYVVIDVLQPVVINYTSYPELWQLLAEAYSRTDQTRRTINALINYLRILPRDPEMTLQLAKEYFKLRDWNRAFETARLAEPLDPTDIIIRLIRIESSIYMATEQDYKIDTVKLDALSIELTQLREKHPERVDIRILQAIIAIYLGQPDKAEMELKLAIEECEEPLKAEMQLVRHYYRTKQMAKALDVCKEACESHRELAEPWLSLSGLYVSSAEYDLARDCLKQGMDAVVGRWEKRSLSIRFALLEIMYADRAKGIDILKEVAMQNEQEVYARSLLLSIREVQQDRTLAERLVSELRKAEGESGLLWRMNQASLWLSSDEWRSKQPDITDTLQYCIDSDSQWSAPVLLLVNMYEKLEDFKRVEDTCWQALVRNPSATDIADKLLTYLERQKRYSDAEKVLRQIEANPQTTSAWHIRMALGAGDFSRAIDELKLRISNDERDVSSRILLARLIYWQTRDIDQAFLYLKEAEAITPYSMALVAAKVTILRAEGQKEEAERILGDYVASSNDFGSYMVRATYLSREGEFERAEADYKKLTTFTENAVTGYQLLGNFYVTQNELDKAIGAIEEGLKSYPADLGLRRSLMKILLMRGNDQDRQKALDILTVLEKRLPQDPELMMFRAMQMLKEPTLQSLETAREELENVVKLNPTSVDAHLMLFNIAMGRGQYQKALDYAIRAIGSNSDNLALILARGRAELELKNTVMAAELADLVIQKDPNNTEAINLLIATGLKSDNQNLLEKAMMLIGSRINLNPSDENLLLQKVQVLVSLGRPQSAIPELKAYYETKDGSNSIPVIVTLADLLRLTGDVVHAEEMIEKAEQIDPNNQNVIHARFLWLVSQNRFEELIGISSAYISAEQQSPKTLLAAASILASSDSMELKNEGLKLFEHVVELSPMSVDGNLGLASTLYQTGNVERAENIYRKMLELCPDNVQVHNDLAWILQEHGNRYADALKLADRGLSLTEEGEQDYLHLLDTRGTILSKLENRLEDAKKDFEKLIELSTSDNRQKAKALLKLGRLCVKLNGPAQAREYLEKALEIDQKVNAFNTDERAEIMEIIQKTGVQAANK